MTKQKTKQQLETENRFLRQLVRDMKACVSPVPGWIPLPVNRAHHDTVYNWLRENFSCNYHEQGYFDGLRYCVFEPMDFPIPMVGGFRLMVEFTNTDEEGSQFTDFWFAFRCDESRIPGIAAHDPVTA